MKYDGGKIILPNGKTAATSRDKRGYNRISIRINAACHTFNAARIICWLVNGQPPSPDCDVDHINRNKGDDRPENLRWVSRADNLRNWSENASEKRKNQFASIPHACGEHIRQAKLTASQVAEIRLIMKTQPVKYSILSKRFGVTRSHIGNILKRRIWAHVPDIDNPTPALPRPKEISLQPTPVQDE